MTPLSDPALRCSFTRLKPHLTLPPLRPSLFFATLKLIHALTTAHALAFCRHTSQASSDLASAKFTRLSRICPHTKGRFLSLFLVFTGRKAL
ncbi:hypothetical protein ACKJV2_000972 [Campylobacter upsaliensis]